MPKEGHEDEWNAVLHGFPSTFGILLSRVLSWTWHEISGGWYVDSVKGGMSTSEREEHFIWKRVQAGISNPILPMIRCGSSKNIFCGNHVGCVISLKNKK